MTTGQSEPADNKNGEGPRSEITGHGENEGCGTTETETLNRESKLAERLETVLRTLELRDVVLTCGFCGHVLNVHADYTDEKDRDEMGKRLHDDADVI